MAEQVPCSFCGKSIPLDSKFCPFCGRGQNEASPQAVAVAASGQSSPGRPFPNAKMPPQYQDGQSQLNGVPTQKKGNKTLVIVLSIVGLVAACCICSYLFPFLQALLGDY
jgi:hypothetical protein